MYDPTLKYEVGLPLFDGDPPLVRQARIAEAHRRIAAYPGVPIGRTHRHEAMGCDLYVVTKYPPEVAARVLAAERRAQEG